MTMTCTVIAGLVLLLSATITSVVGTGGETLIHTH